MWLERTKSLLRWLVVIATAVVVVRVGLNYTSDLKNIDLEFEIFWLIPALIATTAANLLLRFGWRQMFLSFDQALSAGPAVRLWCLAQTARYLPTGLLAIASRLQLAAKAGISRTVTASSLVIETAALFGWALLVCAIFVPSGTLPLNIRWLLGTLSAFGLIISPW